MVDLASLLKALNSEWEKNVRLRVFIVVLILLILCLVSFEWEKINERKIRDVLDLKIQRQLLDQNIGIDNWSARYAEVSELLDLERQSLWSADSEGLAKAKFQKIAQQFFEDSEFDRAIVEVGNLEKLAELDSVFKIRSRVRLLISADQLLQSVARIENSARVVNIARLQLNYSSGRWSAVFVLNAFFEIKEA